MKPDFDLNNTCRVCMSQIMLTRHNIFDSESNIAEKVLFCTGLQFSEDDRLPSQVCGTCIEDLTVAHKFKTTCVRTNEVLQSFLDTEIKQEVNGDDDWQQDVWDNSHAAFKTNISEKNDNIEDSESKKIALKKRGPYKKSGKPRLKKLKFRRLFCEPCGLKFATKKLLEEHRESLHDKDDKSWVCEVCGKVFIHRGSLTSHVRSHLPPRFGCDQCDYKTWNKYDLNKHILIHKGEKLYQCQYCSQSYYTSSNMTSHIRRSHEGQRPFACHLCDRRFFDRTKYNRHIDSHNNVKR
ncbi:hypothetical protein ACJJTC_002698 [Scirpophaga incertulas]